MSPRCDTRICQSCGASNLSNSDVCDSCGAQLNRACLIADHERDLDALLDGLPTDVVQRIKHLHQAVMDKPDSLALQIQLANLYKEHGIKAKAIEHFEIADKLSPGNMLVKERLRQLRGQPPVRPGVKDDGRPLSEVGRVPRWIKCVGLALALVVAAALLKLLLFPATVRVAGYDKFDAVNPQFSPDGEYIAYLKTPKFTLFGVLDQLRLSAGNQQPPEDSTLIAREFPDGPEIELAKFTAWQVYGFQFCWQPGQQALIYEGTLEDGYHPAIYRVDLKRQTPEMLIAGRSPAISPDGKFMAFIASSRGNQDLDLFYGPQLLHIYQFNEVGRPTITAVNGIEAENPVWSPTDNLLAFEGRPTARSLSFTDDDFSGYFKSDIYTYRPESGAMKLTNDGLSRGPLFTPDGKRIAFLRQSGAEKVDNVLLIMDAVGGAPQPLLAPAEQYEAFGAASFAPDSKRLAFEGVFVNPTKPTSNAVATPLGVFGGETNYVTDLFLVNLDGTNLTRLESKRHPYKSQPVFHPRKDWLAYQVQFVDLHKEIWATKVR